MVFQVERTLEQDVLVHRVARPPQSSGFSPRPPANFTGGLMKHAGCRGSSRQVPQSCARGGCEAFFWNPDPNPAADPSSRSLVDVAA